MASCCPTDRPGLPCDYKPKGSFSTAANGTQTYTVQGSDAPALGVVFIPDIFGLGGQLMYVADCLAVAHNAKVVFSDYFEGKPCDRANMPPPGGVMHWIATHGDYAANARPIIAADAAALRASVSSGKVIAISFCWGVKMAVLAANEGLIDGVLGCHPSLLAVEDFVGAKTPALLLPSKDEDEELFAGIEAAIAASPAAGSSEVVYFKDCFHGWMAGRADLADETDAANMEKGLAVVNAFVAKTKF